MANDRVRRVSAERYATSALKATSIDFKDSAAPPCTSERGKILPRRTTGTCAAHQRQLTIAIKRARQIASPALRRRLIE